MKKMTAQQEAEQRFPTDIAGHRMTVKHHDGLYRHLYFARPGTGNMSFSIVTWPGYLAYSGDMGDFVFSRIPDMLEFFRGRTIPDYSYWAEKVQAQDKHAGIEKGRSFSYHYIWCCNALVWAIQQYDLWQDQQGDAR